MVELAGALVLASAFIGIGGGWERVALALALPLLVHPRTTWMAATLLMASLLALAGHLLLDHAAYRLVWLYGAADAPWYLRLGGLWAGDEATLLVLAAGCAAAAPMLDRQDRWAGRGAAIVAGLFLTGALVWNPFVQAPASVRPAANPHLQTVWMAVHPPLVLAGYVLVLAPIGAAVAAVARRPNAWAEIAARTTRSAWLLLSLGLITGMAWAYEDFTFGPLWHWDPVQSAVFAVWALTCAHLHCLHAYRSSEGRMLALWHPLLALLAALAVFVTMAATRHPQLASSHRYVGETSLPLLVMGAAALMLMTGWAIAARYARGASHFRLGTGSVVLTAAIAGLAFTAFIALGELGAATVAQTLGIEKAAAAMPYYEMLARWSSSAELVALNAAFARWEPDPTAINAAALPVVGALALLAGHTLLPLRRLGLRRAITTAMGVAALASAELGGVLQAAYAGRGMTASATVAALPWLDAVLVTLGYVALAGAARAGTGCWRLRHQPLDSVRRMLVGLAHTGAAIGLAALLLATVLDSYAQRMLRWPDDFDRPLSLADGISVTVGRGEVAWSSTEASGAGNVGYVDAVSAAERGPVRIMCEILDYRYARFAGGSAQMITPHIDRDLWRDVQVWVGTADPTAATAEIPLVVKVYPMVTWVWLGFATAVLAAAGMAILDWRIIPQRKGKKEELA